MKHSVETGLTFGLTSGVITTLGLVVGLAAGTQSRAAVLGGILTIAVADSLSDSLGVHTSEEAEGKHTHEEVWVSTLSTFLSKFVVTASFVVPVILLDLGNAVLASVAWAMVLIGALNYWVVAAEKSSKWKTTVEHIGVVLLVAVVTHLVGVLVSGIFA